MPPSESSPADRIRQEQSRLDKTDQKLDGNIDVKDAEKTKALTETYIKKVDDFQARIRSARTKIEVWREARSPKWQAFENTVNGAEKRLADLLAGINVANVTDLAKAKEFSDQIDRFLRDIDSVQAASNPDKSEKEEGQKQNAALDRALTRLDVTAEQRSLVMNDAPKHYESQVITDVLKRLEVLKDLDPAQQVSWLGMKFDKTLVLNQLCRGTLEATRAKVLLSDALEQKVREEWQTAERQVRTYDERIQDIMQGEKNDLDTVNRRTMNSAREEDVNNAVRAVERCQKAMQEVQEESMPWRILAGQLQLLSLKLDINEARNAERDQEANRLVLKAWEQHGSQLEKLDPTLHAQAGPALAALRKNNQLTEFEKQLYGKEFSYDQALKTAVDQQQNIDRRLDYLHQLETGKNLPWNGRAFNLSREWRRNQYGRPQGAPRWRLVTEAGTILTVEPDDAVKRMMDRPDRGEGWTLVLDPTLDFRTGMRITPDSFRYAKVEGGTLTLQKIVGGFIEGDSEVSVNDLHRESAEKTRDISRVLDRSPAILGVRKIASKLQRPLEQLREMLAAGTQGTKRESFVSFAREKAEPLLHLLEAEETTKTIEQAKTQLEILKKVRIGITRSDPEAARIERQIQALTEMIGFLESGSVKEILSTIVRSASFDADTWGKWFANDAPKILASVVVAVAATTLVVITCGAATPLIMLAAAGTAGGMVGYQLGAEGVYYGRQMFDPRVRSGEMYFHERSSLGQYLSTGKMIDPETGLEVPMEFLKDVVTPHLKEFAVGFVVTFATMGAGKVAGEYIGTYLAKAATGKAVDEAATLALARQVSAVRASYDQLAKSGMERTGKSLVRQCLTHSLGMAKETAIETADEGIGMGLERIDQRLGVLYSVARGAQGKFREVRLERGVQKRLLLGQARVEGDALHIPCEGERAPLLESLAKDLEKQGYKRAAVEDDAVKVTLPSGEEFRVALEEAGHDTAVSSNTKRGRGMQNAENAKVVPKENVRAKTAREGKPVPEFIQKSHPEIGKLMEYVSMLENQPTSEGVTLVYARKDLREASSMSKLGQEHISYKRGVHPNIERVIALREEMSSRLRLKLEQMENQGRVDTEEFRTLRREYEHNQEQNRMLRRDLVHADYLRAGAEVVGVLTEEQMNTLYDQGPGWVNPHAKGKPVVLYKFPEIVQNGAGVDTFDMARAFGDPVIDSRQARAAGQWMFVAGGRTRKQTYVRPKVGYDAGALPGQSVDAIADNPQTHYIRLNAAGRYVFLSEVGSLPYQTAAEKAAQKVHTLGGKVYSGRESAASKIQAFSPEKIYMPDPSAPEIGVSDGRGGMRKVHARILANQGRIDFTSQKIREVDNVGELPAILGKALQRNAIDLQQRIAEELFGPVRAGSMNPEQHADRWHRLANDVLRSERSALIAAEKTQDPVIVEQVRERYLILRKELLDPRLIPDSVLQRAELGIPIDATNVEALADRVPVTFNTKRARDSYDTFRDVRRSRVRLTMMDLPSNDPQRLENAKGLLQDEAKTTVVRGRDGNPLDFTPNGSVDRAIRKAHDIGDTEQKAGRKPFSKAQLAEKMGVLMQEGSLTSDQADAVMRSGIAGLEKNAAERTVPITPLTPQKPNVVRPLPPVPEGNVHIPESTGSALENNTIKPYDVVVLTAEATSTRGAKIPPGEYVFKNTAGQSALMRLDGRGGYAIDMEALRPSLQRVSPTKNISMAEFSQKIDESTQVMRQSAKRETPDMRFKNPEETRQFLEKKEKYPWNNALQYPRTRLRAFDVAGEDGHVLWLQGDEAGHLAIPKDSPVQKFLLSKPGTTEHVALQKIENVLADAFADAKRFFPAGAEIQKGFVVEGSGGFGMEVGNVFGVRVNVERIEDFVRIIENGDVAKIMEMRNYLKGEFVHEMVHNLRDEACGFSLAARNNTEVASHAVQFLALEGKNARFNEELREAMQRYTKTNELYDLDRVKVLQILMGKLRSLAKAGKCKAPVGFDPDALRDSIESIRENEREKILKDLADEFIHTPSEQFPHLAKEAEAELMKGTSAKN